MRKVRAVIASSCTTCQVIDKRMLPGDRQENVGGWALMDLIVFSRTWCVRGHFFE